MTRTVKLPQPARLQLIAWAQKGYPHESCGVLVGNQDTVQVSIARVVLARNVNTERPRDRYQLDARDLLAADRSAEAGGLEIVGIWHTHPDHPAHPSEHDRVQAWQGWSYLILSVERDRVTELRSWRLTNGAFQEETIIP
jgi:proteasome lid subunit RPN8/RPN11